MPTQKIPASQLDADSFVPRHIGPSDADIQEMASFTGFTSLDALIDATVPDSIRLKRPLAIAPGKSETEALRSFREIASRNQVFRSFIGLGYYSCLTPPVILRNILESPAWYTAYTPYQAEIAQGRLEALLNFQTMVMDLTGLEIANASLLDEGTAAAEAMHMSYALKGKEGRSTFFVSADCFPQTIDVVRTRAKPIGITVVVGDHRTFKFGPEVFGALVQYPAADGAINDYRAFTEAAHAGDAMLIAATDLLALTLLTPPGEWGADVAVGNTQRFGVPLGFGGPHAAFFATKDEYKRHLPGRIIGVSRDADGKPALRMALQTREQHIRREKATSNVCTAQVLLAVMASMYAVWHGAAGLTRIATRIHRFAEALADGLRKMGYGITHEIFFDTIRVELGTRRLSEILREARAREINVRVIDDTTVGIALGESTLIADIADLLAVFDGKRGAPESADQLVEKADPRYDERFARTSAFLTHPVFSRYRSETEMLRYMRTLESRDLSLTHSMIPLGSCTMKLNATSEMVPVSWREISRLHPVRAERADRWLRRSSSSGSRRRWPRSPASRRCRCSRTRARRASTRGCW